ncbi:MAG: hypothetical protein E7527_04960 [Ruminococcaceae bacterium]|nr:hypothetical protein [Oscillospiraceae bacterium]
MDKKFKVESYAWYGKNKTDTYYTFDEAMAGFRQRILSPEGVPHIVDMIHAYAAEHYPENTPVAFGQLAELLQKLLTDPTYPASQEDLVLEDFEDENVRFYLDPWGGIFSYVDNEDYDGKFPLAEINVIPAGEEEEYFFYLTQEKSGACWSWNYVLSPIGEEDENDEDEDEEDDFYNLDGLDGLEGLDGLDELEDLEGLEDLEDLEGEA